jgi:hypothetical protein
VRDGRQRRRQVHAAQAGRGRTAARCGQRHDRRQREARATSRSTRWSCSTPSSPSRDPAARAFPLATRARCATSPARSASPATTSTRAAACSRAARRRASCSRQDALRPAELPRARRADQPPRHGHQGDALEGARDFEGTMLFVSHDRSSSRALQPRARAHPGGPARRTAAATPSTSRRPATRPRAPAPDEATSIAHDPKRKVRSTRGRKPQLVRRRNHRRDRRALFGLCR